MGDRITVLLENMPVVSQYATLSGMRFLLEVVRHHQRNVDSNLLSCAYVKTTEAVAGAGRLPLVRLMLDGFLHFDLVHEDLESLLVSAANAAIREDQRLVIRHCCTHPSFNPNQLVNNRSALMTASASGNLFAQKLLLRLPTCKPGLENMEGLSALSYAKQVNNQDGLRILQREIANNNRDIVIAIDQKLHELKTKVEKKNAQWARRHQLFSLNSHANDYEDSVFIPIFAQLKTALERNADREAEKVLKAYLCYATKKYNTGTIKYLRDFLADHCPALHEFVLPANQEEKRARIEPPSLHYARFHAH